MKVIVVGGGKVGFYLAKTLGEHGHKPVLIERNKALCSHVANQLDMPVVWGDGTMLETLEAAGAADADAFVSVTGRDEDNLIACQMAKQQYGIPRTVARVNNPKNKEVMRKLGVDIPISSTDNIARMLEREIDASAIKELISINGGEASINELQIPENYPLSGSTLTELKPPAGSVIISIIRDGALIVPRGKTQILSGDKIIALVQGEALHDFQEKMMLLEEQDR